MSKVFDIRGFEGMVLKLDALSFKQKLKPEGGVGKNVTLCGGRSKGRKTESDEDGMIVVFHHGFVGRGNPDKVEAIESLFLSGGTVPEFSRIVAVKSARARNFVVKNFGYSVDGEEADRV